MLNEQVEDADLVLRDLRNRRANVICDEVGATRLRGQRELFLEERHDGWQFRFLGWWWGRGKDVYRDFERQCDQLVEEARKESKNEDGEEEKSARSAVC